MAIKKKSPGSIVPKYSRSYSPLDFSSFVEPNFIEATAEQVIARIKPAEFDFMPGRKFVAVDTETFYTGVASNHMPSHVVRRWIKTKSGKEIPNDFPFTIQICDGTNSFIVYDTLENKFAEFRKLSVILNDPTIDKVGHNIDYDLHMINNAGVKMSGQLWDTLFLSKLTRAGAFTHGLLDVSVEIQDEEPTVTTFEYMVDSYKAMNRVTDYRQIPKELLTQYGCADTWNTLLVFKHFYPLLSTLDKEKDLRGLYELENEVMLVCYSMERTGIRVDENYKDILIPELTAEADAAEKEIYETAGMVFNINSGQQIYSALNKLGFGHLVKIKRDTGNPILDAIAMEELDNQGVPLVSKIQGYKAANKLLNTFAIKLYEMCDSQDMVHCNINSMEAKTGRFSISSPSMQNMPRRKDSRVRDAFIAPDGYTLYDFDFKSQEAIILVHYSQAPYLLEIINSGGDIHRAIGGLIYSCKYEDVTKKQREAAKSVEFAIIYGAGAAKVITMPGMEGVTIGEANAIIYDFKRNVPEVDAFIKAANNKAKSARFVRTILGRRVYVDHNKEYACVNYAIQGSAADSTKTRLVALYKFLRANGFSSKMILQVHDSLLYIIKQSEEYILGWLRWIQTERDLFRIHVTVDVAICSPSWRTKEDVDVAAVEPPADLMQKARDYNMWEGYFE